MRMAPVCELLAACAVLAMCGTGVVDATAPHLCGDKCSNLFAHRPHSDSCWREDTQSYFSFDLQPHFHVSDACFGENDPSAPFYFNGLVPVALVHCIAVAYYY